MKHRPLGFQCEKLFTADLFSDLKRDIDTRLESLNPSVVEHDDSGEALERAECDATIAALRDEKALFERHLAAAKEATAAKAALRGEAEAGVLAGEAERRRLHNEVMELNDNVRVFCRVRTPNAGEELVVQTSEKAVLVDAVNFSGKRETKRFEFDRVFGAAQQQTDVFVEISQFIRSPIDSYRT